MLIQFRFENFKSFRDDTILDFSATKITEHSNRVVQLGKEKILPVAAIYGANASGKSNVLEAFRFMETYVLESFAYNDITEKKSKIRKAKYTPFLFDNTTREGSSLFEVYFIASEDEGCKTYNYGFTLNQEGIVEEWLNIKSKTAREFKAVFYRDKNNLDLSGLPKNSQENIRTVLGKESLIVSYGAMFKIEKLKTVLEWFYSSNSVNFGDPLENVYLSHMYPNDFAEDKRVQQNVIKYLSSFDSAIQGFDIEVVKEEEDEETKVLKIDTLHKIIGTNDTYPISLKDESAGTLKMFALYPILEDTLVNGSVLFVDELNARLHPLLVRLIILSFLNEETNPKHAQLVFTAHDTWQLANDMLRRDEIWFTDKNEEGVSTLYSLADFTIEDGSKIRKDENYEKNYLLGKYGAIPCLKYFDMFRG